MRPTVRQNAPQTSLIPLDEKRESVQLRSGRARVVLHIHVGACKLGIKEANKVLELALNGMYIKLRQKNGPLNFQELGVLTATDASFAGESGS